MVETRQFVCLFLICLVIQVVYSTSSWKYGKDEVLKWQGSCQTGQSQSPIDIDTTRVVKKTEERFTFSNYNQKLKKIQMKNNGHTVKFEFQSQKPLKLMGGGLPGGPYQLAQGHLHWAHSEHTVDGHSSKVELHLVHFNLARGQTLNEAVATNEHDALAVLGIMIDTVNGDLERVYKFFNALEEVKENGKVTDIDTDLLMSDLLPENVDMFYRYNGSLTTPTCDEVVVWTVFKEKVLISNYQYRQLEGLKMEDGKSIAGNFRPTKPLNGRQVLYVDARDFSDGDCSGSSDLKPFKSSLVVTLVYAYLTSLRRLN